jgi:glucose/mannose-6-phosphate isomerase
MLEAIKNFSKQFAWEPVVQNSEFKAHHSKFVVVGMGGSHLAADLVQSWNPLKNILIHKNYGLPLLSGKGATERLIILSSYSGNTEEVIDAFQEAKKRNLAMAAITVGGKLIDLARENNIPYIQLPDIGIQPRSALGFSLKAILKAMDEEELLVDITELTNWLKPENYDLEGKRLAEKLKGRVPIIYSSEKNKAIAYNWKVKFNETVKIPSFYNAFPELNHNEMTGFDVQGKTKDLSDNFHFLILKDSDDDLRIAKRMSILNEFYKARNFPVEILELKGDNFWQKAFSSIILADWTAYYLALEYGIDPDQIPMVEEFKRRIKN